MHSVLLQESIDVFTMIEVVFALQHLAGLKIQGIEEHTGVQVCILTGGEDDPAILNQDRSMHGKQRVDAPVVSTKPGVFCGVKPPDQPAGAGLKRGNRPVRGTEDHDAFAVDAAGGMHIADTILTQ